MQDEEDFTSPRQPPSAQTRVLVVCTGNLCRSPLAEALLRKHSVAAGVDLEVTSVGVAAQAGLSADPKVRRLAHEHGVDLSGHRSRQLTPNQLAHADLVLTMTSAHLSEVRQLDPGSAARSVPLKLAAWRARTIAAEGLPLATWVTSISGQVPLSVGSGLPTDTDVDDPFGRSMRKYRAMGREVDALVRDLISAWPRT